MRSECFRAALRLETSRRLFPSNGSCWHVLSSKDRMPLFTLNHSLRIRALALAAFFAGRCTVAATIIGSSGYDADPSPGAGYEYTYGFDFAGYGNGGANHDLGEGPVQSIAGNAPSEGTGGSGAMFVAADARAVPAPGTNYPTPSDPPVVYSYWGFGGGNGLTRQNATLSNDLPDYTFSIDLRVEGLRPEVTGAFCHIEIEFLAVDGILGDPPDGNLDRILKLQFATETGPRANAPFVTSAFQTFGFTLDRGLITIGTADNLFIYGESLLYLNLNFLFLDGARDFGLDAGNAFYADNASLVQIPEPVTAMVFLAAAWVALLLRRH